MIFFQYSSIALAFVAVAVYLIFTVRFARAPLWCWFLCAGFAFNAVQKLTVLPAFQSGNYWIQALDEVMFPWAEAAAYAIAAFILISHQTTMSMLAAKVKKGGLDA